MKIVAGSVVYIEGSDKEKVFLHLVRVADGQAQIYATIAPDIMIARTVAEMNGRVYETFTMAEVMKALELAYGQDDTLVNNVDSGTLKM